MISRRSAVVSTLIMAASMALPTYADADVSTSPKLISQKSFRALLDFDRPFKGPRNAKVSVVEFGDFACPFTNRARTAVNFLLKTYSSNINYCFRNLPLSRHGPSAILGASYYEAVAAIYPARAWEFFDILFDNQELIAEQLDHATQGLAAKAGFRLSALAEELNQSTVHRLIRSDVVNAQALGLEYTPTFLINGTILEGLPELRDMVSVVKQHLHQASAKQT